MGTFLKFACRNLILEMYRRRRLKKNTKKQTTALFDQFCRFKPRLNKSVLSKNPKPLSNRAIYYKGIYPKKTLQHMWLKGQKGYFAVLWFWARTIETIFRPTPSTKTSQTSCEKCFPPTTLLHFNLKYVDSNQPLSV